MATASDCRSVTDDRLRCSFKIGFEFRGSVRLVWCKFFALPCLLLAHEVEDGQAEEKGSSIQGGMTLMLVVRIYCLEA